MFFNKVISLCVASHMFRDALLVTLFLSNLRSLLMVCHPYEKDIPSYSNMILALNQKWFTSGKSAWGKQQHAHISGWKIFAIKRDTCNYIHTQVGDKFLQVEKVHEGTKRSKLEDHMVVQQGSTAMLKAQGPHIASTAKCTAVCRGTAVHPPTYAVSDFSDYLY